MNVKYSFNLTSLNSKVINLENAISLLKSNNCTEDIVQKMQEEYFAAKLVQVIKLEELAASDYKIELKITVKDGLKKFMVYHIGKEKECMYKWSALRKPNTKLSVKCWDGECIKEKYSKHTFAKTIEKYGNFFPEKIWEINSVNSRPILSRNRVIRYSPVEIEINGIKCYVNTLNSTQTLKEQLEKMTLILGQKISVNVLAS